MKKTTALLLLVIVLLLGATAASAQQQARGPFTCTLSLKPNGGFRVDCDPVTAVTPQPTMTATRPGATQPVATNTPASTQVATPTGAPTAPPLPTQTPVPGVHNVIMWHPPTDHHHGQNPADTIFADFVADFWTTEIGNAWQTSAGENMYPDGKHAGFTNLYEANTGCTQFNNGGGISPGNCVKAYLMQVHTLGTGSTVRTRLHSNKLVALVCGVGGAPPCDFVGMGERTDYGQYHSAYKKSICWADPQNPIPMSAGSNVYLNQPPYRTIIGSARYGIFWSSLINTLGRQFYDPDPSELYELAWNELNAWTTPDLADCYNPAADHSVGGDGTRFQVFSMFLHIGDFPRPFDGFTDGYGRLNAACTEEGFDCIPLHIGANVPAGDAFFNRQVTHGDASVAPIQAYPCPDCVMPKAVFP